MLNASAILLFLVGSIHSLLGEKYILVRLFKRNDLPQLFGSDRFTKSTLRFAWHLTTVSWFGFALILIELSKNDSNHDQRTLQITSGTFFISGVLSIFFSKGKHLSWIVFWTVSALLAVSAVHVPSFNVNMMK